MKRSGRIRVRGRGSYRGQPARHIESLMKVKPFVTPEIENINMELELLKQKREMIEQHQNILKSQIMFSQKRQHGSENPRYFEQDPYDSPGPSRSNRNFARFYDDPVAEDYIPLSSGRKRAADGGWPRGSSPKRFDSPRGSVVQSFGSRLGPKPTPQSHKPVSSGSHTSQDWELEPMSRKRGRPYRSPAVMDTMHSAHTVSKPKDREAYTLRADREPSTSLNGILELGLGFILKDLKQKYGQPHKHNRLVTREYYIRRVKKILRNRIRNIFMNKYVDSFIDVANQYRKKFPQRTDEELMIAALNGEVNEPRTYAELKAEAPRKGMPCPSYFKKNMRQYVQTKLKKMFTDIDDMYNPPIETNEEAPVDSTVYKADDDDVRNVPPRKDEPKWKINVASLVDSRLSSMMKKYVPSITAILNMDPEYNATKASWLATTMKMDPSISNDVVTGDWPQKIIEIEPIELPKSQHYYAKVDGSPYLPQRILMRPFLDQFFPIATKTHKKLKNLLYVTFNNKDYYDKFLAQDGVTVGECTLNIKVSGKVNPVQEKTNENSDNVNTGIDSQDCNDKNDISIPADLDDKINDLLSSIRKGEEQPADEENTDTNMEENGDVAESQNENNDNNPTEDNECVEQNAVIETNDKQSVNTESLTDKAPEENNVEAENVTIGDPPTENKDTKGTEDKKAESIESEEPNDTVEKTQNDTN